MEEQEVSQTEKAERMKRWMLTIDDIRWFIQRLGQPKTDEEWALAYDLHMEEVVNMDV